MTWLSFALLGSACIKVACKHVGEIDPREMLHSSAEPIYPALPEWRCPVSFDVSISRRLETYLINNAVWDVVALYKVARLKLEKK
jgi:hypothetical protein